MRSSIFSTLAATAYAGTLTGHTRTVKSVAFSPDGRTLVTDSEDTTAILWDLADPARPLLENLRDGRASRPGVAAASGYPRSQHRSY